MAWSTRIVNKLRGACAAPRVVSGALAGLRASRFADLIAHDPFDAGEMSKGKNRPLPRPLPPRLGERGIFSSYRELVMEAEAKKWFAIMPAKKRLKEIRAAIHCGHASNQAHEEIGASGC